MALGQGAAIDHDELSKISQRDVDQRGHSDVDTDQVSD